MKSIRCRAAALLVLVAAGVAAPEAARAQVGVPARRSLQLQPRIGVGFTANVPDQLVGGSVHFLSGRFGGLGLYADVKLDMESPEDDPGFTDNITPREVEETRNHRLFDSDASVTSVNVALMRALSPQFTLYAGAGYSDVTEYVQYWDESGDTGDFGYYWVEDEENSAGKVNLLGGAMFQLGESFAIQMGAESKPAGFTFGVSYLIPMRR